VCTPHLAETKINCVEKRSAASCAGSHHAILQIFNAVGECAGEFGAFVEANHEKFIGGIGGLEELHRSFAGFGDFVRHAAAEIEDDADGNGYIF